MANKSGRKTLVFSFDGTGNEPSDAGDFGEDESISNVLKLHILMGGGLRLDESSTKTPDGHDQLTYYYNGIGTRDSRIAIPLLGSICSKAKKFINQAIAPKFGDAERILREAQCDFKSVNYQKGDTLAVFGFSRGAALARKFASRILKEYPDCEVSFLGVFDTVAAMNGIHRKNEHISSDVFFENGTLNDGIKRAVHIVSLDEDRVPFSPTLINKDEKNPQRILEIWFPGVHSDIGGGYWFDGLSDTVLEFMIEECKKSLGKSIDINSGKINKEIFKLLDQQKKELSNLDVDDISINPMVDGPIHRHLGILAKIGDLDPRLVCVNINDRPSDHYPIVHKSVMERFSRVTDYRPVTLRGLEFKLFSEGAVCESVIRGISGLREELEKPDT